ncbi:MAG: T9SS type A sorting domain-containing protein [Chitinophagaceae bacterium]|nr:MAG: T9SS type A sorting domain-containing protein [Chitinophagaceae bacterium]
MKRLLPSFLLFILSVVYTQVSEAQTTVNSSTGYSVTLNVRPVRMIVTQYWSGGYNYQIEVAYNIAFSGNNRPSSMYNLPGEVGCGNERAGFQLPTSGSGNVMTYNKTASGDYRNASLANMGCNSVTLTTVDGPGISVSNLVIQQPVVLGVKMASFSASLKSNKVTLDWSTASEENNNFFTIERSVNGNTWSAISQVKSSGNGSTVNYYSYTDASPAIGISYYRIRQTDLDGGSTVSEVKTVNNAGTAKTIGLYPVPNNGNNITVTGIRDYSNFQLAVIASNGNAIYNTTLSGASVTLPELAKGFYFIRITDKMSGEVNNIRYIRN